MLNLSTGSETHIIGGEDWGIGTFDIAPDGNKIVFSSNKGTYQGRNTRINSNLWNVNTDGGWQMNKISITLIVFSVMVSQVLAGPPPDVWVSEGLAPQPTKKMARWFCFEYGWYGPSLKDLNKTFSGMLGGEKIGMNDYLGIGIGMPMPGDNRMGLFFGYWNGSAKNGSIKLNLNMITFSPEGSFSIFKVQEKAHFLLGFIVRDVFTWWTFNGAGLDTTDFCVVTDFGAKFTTEYYPIKSLSVKFDLQRIFLSFDWSALSTEDKTKLQTPGWIIKFGLNLYY